MKVWFNEDGTIDRTEGSVVFQGSGNFNYLYMYGIPAGETIEVTFHRPDNKRYGPLSASYGTDTDGVDCVVARFPKEALEVAGGLQVYILANHEEDFTDSDTGVVTTETVTQAYAGMTMKVNENKSVVVP